jgi:hypothetical protein
LHVTTQLGASEVSGAATAVGVPLPPAIDEI